MAIDLTKFWAGTEEAYYAAQSGMEAAAKMTAEFGSSGGPSLPTLWAKAGNVAIIGIEGALVSGSSGYGRFFGVIGYDDIANALTEAMLDPEIGAILLNISSGGGAVAGVDDLAKMVARYRAVKPMVAYTPSTMASAAYWFGCNADTVLVASTSIVGSIGVMAIHVERSQMLKAAGINVTLVRSAENKALANPVEPLSEAGKAQLQAEVDDLDSIFVSQVAVARDMTVAQVRADTGKGGTFIGKKAVAAGLADKVASFDQAYSAAKALDKKPKSANNSGNPKGKSNMAAQHLTTEQLTALSAGASVAEVEAMASAGGAATGELTPEQQAVADAAAATAAAAAATESEDAVAAATAAAAAAAASSTPSAEVTALTAQVAVLTSQATELNTRLIAAGVENSTLKTASASVQVSYDGLLAIARGAVGKMQIALGGSDLTATMDGAAVIAAFTATEVTFKQKFKIGGAASAAASTKKTESVIDPLALAAVQSSKV